MLNRTAGLILLLVGAAGYGFAAITVPEIDASTGTAAIALLSGGMVVLWGRRRAR